MNLLRLVITFIKLNLKDFGFWFWMLVFPLMLAGLFVMTTQNIQDNLMEDVNVGVESDNLYETILKTIDEFNVHTMTETEALVALTSEEIDAYVKGNGEIIVESSGINQTIIEEVVNEVHQIVSTDLDFRYIDFETSYIEEDSYDSEPHIVMFFSLLAMYTFYSMFSAMEIVIYLQANLSPQGGRFYASPFNKLQVMVANLISAVILGSITLGAIIIFLMVMYQNTLFDELFYTLLLLFIGLVSAVGIGFIIGALPLKSEAIKTVIPIIFTLVLAQISGLGGPFLRQLVNDTFPWLNQFNPMAMITDTLYRINYMGNFSTYLDTILTLLGILLVTMIISYFLLRRQQYDSL